MRIRFGHRKVQGPVGVKHPGGETAQQHDGAAKESAHDEPGPIPARRETWQSDAAAITPRPASAIVNDLWRVKEARNKARTARAKASAPHGNERKRIGVFHLPPQPVTEGKVTPLPSPGEGRMSEGARESLVRRNHLAIGNVGEVFQDLRIDIDAQGTNTPSAKTNWQRPDARHLTRLFGLLVLAVPLVVGACESPCGFTARESRARHPPAARVARVARRAAVESTPVAPPARPAREWG